MKNYKLKTLHIVNLDPSHGGPTSVVQELQQCKYKNFTLKAIDSRKISIWTLIFNKRIKKFMNKFDLVHCHSFFTIQNIILAKLALNLSLPTVFTLHGNFNVWSLNQKYIFKRIYIFFLKKFIQKITIHFLNKYEKDEFKINNNYKKNFLFSNSLNVKNIKNLIKPKKFFFHNSELKILFFGRIDKKKGIDLAILALKKLIDEKIFNVKLNIYGPADKIYLEKINLYIKKNNLKNFIKIQPPAYGYEKYKILQNHDLFILPSLDEADSVAIKESLLSETPVIISDNCKFDEIHQIGGIVCKPSIDTISEAIKFFLSNPEKLIEMSKLGKNLIIKDYDMDKNIKILNNVYHSLYLRSNRTYDYDGYNFYE